jgi:hypothetical protein
MRQDPTPTVSRNSRDSETNDESAAEDSMVSRSLMDSDDQVRGLMWKMMGQTHE